MVDSEWKDAMPDDLDTLKKANLGSKTNPEPVETEPETEPAHQDSNFMAKKSAMGMTLVLAAVVVLAGIGSGYALHAFFPMGGSSSVGTTQPVTLAQEQIEVNGVYGAEDETAFRDLAEGVLVKGGIEGEGSHHLVRPGGLDQYVYLTSTILDMDLFIGNRIKVWGETFDAQKAGWLMDVGRVQVVEIQAELPPGAQAE